jgi:hypothetical protein
MFDMRKFLGKYSYYQVEDVSSLLDAPADADDDELFADDPQRFLILLMTTAYTSLGSDDPSRT